MLGDHKPTEPAEYSGWCQGEYYSGDLPIDGEADKEGSLVLVFSKFLCRLEGEISNLKAS